jgi:hypothetical protein
VKFYNVSGEEIPGNLKLSASNVIEMEGGIGGERNSLNPQLKNVTAIPNPFEGSVMFAFELKEDAPVTIQMFNIDGKLVAEQFKNLPGGQQEIQISGLNNYPPGIYSYSILSEGVMIRGKLVKK